MSINTEINRLIRTIQESSNVLARHNIPVHNQNFRYSSGSRYANAGIRVLEQILKNRYGFVENKFGRRIAQRKYLGKNVGRLDSNNCVGARQGTPQDRSV